MHNSYYNYPFSGEVPQDGFFEFLTIAGCLEKCKDDNEEIVKCRTIGILYSDGGRYYLKELESELKLRVSVRYLKTPPQSTIIPYPVQLFGDLQWRNRAVIFVKIIQQLKASTALRMLKTLSSVTERHCARNSPWINNHT